MTRERSARYIQFEQAAEASPRCPLSLREYKDQIVFQNLTGIDLQTTDEEVGQLKLWEWLRAYNVLRDIAIQYLTQADDACDPCKLTRAALLEALRNHGLELGSAETFVRHASFATNSVDLHDCPLLNVGQDKFCLLLFIATVQTCAKLLLSQCGRFRHRFQSKGGALEQQLIALLTRYHIPCNKLNRKVNGQPLEIDCLVLWNKTLFVIECKNYALPSERTRHQYDFCLDQLAAKDQVLRKVELIKLHHGIVRELFGRNASFDRIVPVILNGPPFSLPEPIDDVYFTDLDAVETFFSRGVIQQFEEKTCGFPDVPTSGPTVRLWKGNTPTADDFARYLCDNPLFELTSTTLKPSVAPVPLGGGKVVLTTIIGVGNSIQDEWLDEGRKLFGNIQSCGEI